MRKLKIVERISPKYPGRILLDVRSNRRSWVSTANKNYTRQISYYLSKHTKITKTIWTYLVVNSDSPALSGTRSASYQGNMNKETLLTTSYNDFMQEMAQRFKNVSPELLSGVEPLRDSFQLSERPLREIVEVQFGRGVYRWQPFIKSPGITE